MTSIHYQHDCHQERGGGWLAAVHENSVLLVEVPGTASEAAARVQALWRSLGSAGGIQTTLDELTRAGLSATPPFALVQWEGALESGAVRTIVRGSVTLTVQAEGGTSTADASGVSTWLEQQYSAVRSVELRVGPTAGASSDAAAPGLPLRSGVVWATSIVVDHSPLASAAENPLTVNIAVPVVPSAPVAPPAGIARPVTVSPAVAVVPPIIAPPAAGSPAVAAAQPTVEPPAPPVWVDPEATVTGLTSRLGRPVADAVPEAAGSGSGGESSYDYLFGETVFRTVEDAAVREEGEPASGAPAVTDASASDVGDHDGHTVASVDIAKLRAGRKTRGAAKPAASAAASIPRLYLEMVDGSREPLTQPIMVGRAPSVTKVSGGQMPKLLTVGGPDQDISRNHAQFAVEGGTVVVTDLHSRNGTMIVLPGRPPQQLRQGEPTSVIVGTVIDLGDGVTFTVGEE